MHGMQMSRSASCLRDHIRCWQEGASQHAEGAAIQARVLDVSKAEGIIDLSLRPQLITPILQSSRLARGKRKAAAADAGDPVVRSSCKSGGP